MDGNGRIGRLLTLLLLHQAGYEVGRYISLDLERIVDESKETYYESLLKSSQKWHEAQHDLRPWWNYFLGMLTAAYKEFELRVGTIRSARGAKREMVRRAVDRMTGRFTVGDLKRTCPGVSYPTLQRAAIRAELDSPRHRYPLDGFKAAATLSRTFPSAPPQRMALGRSKRGEKSQVPGARPRCPMGAC